MSIDVAQVPSRIMEYLRRMDQEATSLNYYQGIEYPTRLREYVNHVFPNRDPRRTEKQKPYEEAVTARLAELFLEDGARAETFTPYPSGEKGDLVVGCNGQESLWIEMKGAWTYNLHPRPNPNGTYKKHLTSVTEGVPKDFLKLRRVTPDMATHVGILVFGFEAPTHGFRIKAEDLQLMKDNGEFSDFEWSECCDEWADGILAGSKVRCWFWHRPVPQ